MPPRKPKSIHNPPTKNDEDDDEFKRPALPEMTPRSPSLRTVHIGYLQMLVDCLAQCGVDTKTLFGTALLTELRTLDPNTRRPLEEWEQMVAQAQAAVGEDFDVALRMGDFVKPWDTGPIGFITMASRNLREAAEALAQFYALLNDAYELVGEVVHGRFEIRMRPLSATRSPALERVTLTTICWHARWLARRPDLRFDVRLGGEPPAGNLRRAYETAFGGKVEFGDASDVSDTNDSGQAMLHGPADYETLPVSRGDHGVQDVLRAQLMAEMALLHEASASFVHRVERILQPRLESGEIALEDVAVEAGVSVRTLQVKLEQSGLSFRALLDRMRHAQALVYLSDPALSLVDITHMLGFSSQSSFQTAFKRWTDTTPGTWRKRRLQAGAAPRTAPR